MDLTTWVVTVVAGAITAALGFLLHSDRARIIRDSELALSKASNVEREQDVLKVHVQAIRDRLGNIETTQHAIMTTQQTILAILERGKDGG